MKPLSIKLQLSLMVSVLTLLIITVLSISAYIEFEESLLGNIDTTLRAMAEGIRAELDEQDSRERREAELLAITGRNSLSDYGRYRIWLEHGQESPFLSDPPDDPFMQQLLRPPTEEQPDVGDVSLFSITDSEGAGRFRTIWMRYPADGDVVNILVARSSDYAYHELEEFLQLLLVSGGSVTLITLLLVPRIIAWGLRSITAAGRHLERITHRNLGREDRVMGDVPVELHPFQLALDGMLARLNTAVRRQEQLTADVAHELRTPLAIMKSTIQTVRMRPRTAAEYEEGMDDTLRDIDRMEQLVQQLLTLARLDVVDEIPDPVEVRLDALLQSLADAFADRAERQGASVVCMTGATVSVQGNEMELQQLFSNLIENALRYGPPRGIVRIALEDGPAPWVTACVQDEGGVIPPEVLPHLFDRFYRADSSRSQASGGVGLGLAIAREIVLRHHGDIVITSEPHTGTTVTVRLPRK